MPLAALNFVLDPFALAWYYNSFLLYFSTSLWIPRAWHLHGLKYTPNKLFLLRGGKVIKVESRNFGNY